MSKNKERDCPALGRAISSKHCGSERQTIIPCPEDCPYNPFSDANYDQFQEVEQRLIGKTFKRLALALNSAERNAIVEAMDEKDIFASSSLVAYQVSFRKYPDHCSFFERWEKEGHVGLCNDEVVLAKGHAQQRPALLEFRRLIDHQTIECVDLLSEGQPPFRVVDQSLARTFKRFAILLGWIFPGPHFFRASGGAIFLEGFTEVPGKEILAAMIAHLGGPSDAFQWVHWLAVNMVRVKDCWLATSEAQADASMNTLDALFTKTRYALKVDGDLLRSRLDAQDNIAHEKPSESELSLFHSGWVILEPGSRESGSMGRPNLGRVLLGHGAVQLEASSGAKSCKLKQWFEDLMGGYVAFESERADDLVKQIRGNRGTKYRRELAAPKLIRPMQLEAWTSLSTNAGLKSPKELNLEFIQNFYREFADTPVAMLGMTPRQAAQAPSTRPQLIQLMKSHVRDIDTHRRDKGFDIDINWLLADLGLDELILPPAPLPEIVEEEDFQDEEEDFRTLFDPPARPVLSEDEVMSAMERHALRFRSPKSGQDHLQKLWPELVDLLEEALHEATDRDYGILFPPIMLAACALHSYRPKNLVVDIERLSFYYLRELDAETEAIERGNDAFESFLNQSPQPNLVGFVLGIIFSNSKKAMPDPRFVSKSVGVLKAWILEMSHFERQSPGLI